MTVTAAEAPPDLRRAWRSARTPLLLSLAVLTLLVTSAVLSAAGEARPLDPRDASPDGSRAVAELLRHRGVRVTPVTDVSEALAGGAGALVVVPVPALVPRADLGRLADAAVPLLVVAPSDEELSALRLPLRQVGVTAVGRRLPDCSLAAARTAGDADLGGAVYATESGAASGCYPAGGDPSLVVVRSEGREAVVVGAADVLQNRRLGYRGNAALSLSLLGSTGAVRWLIPRPPAASAATGERRGLVSLLPSSVKWATVEVLVAVVLLALWRARRLGPVVDEPLPVVVRAAESVEGQARLYRAAGARGAAAESLRSASRTRLTVTLGLPGDPTPQVLVTAVSARSARPPGDVGAVLYGAGPGAPPGDVPDDRALVRLAAELDRLEAEVRRS